MLLPVGKIMKNHFRLMRNTFIFEHGDHALILEKEKGAVTCYATNAACSEIYGALPLGKKQDICKKQFVTINYSEDIMLVDANDLLIVVDFGLGKMAVNQPQFRAFGSKAWGEAVQMPWQSRYNVLFGLPGEGQKLDEKAAVEFWNWFQENEGTIASRMALGGNDAQEVTWLIRKNLAPVFALADETELGIQVDAGEGKHTLAVSCPDNETLQAALEELGSRMPERLQKTWNYITKA